MTAPTTSRRTSSTPTRKTSLYRLRSAAPDEDLRAFITPRYLDRDGFTVQTVDHDGVQGLLVTGTTAPGDTDWCGHLIRLTGLPVSEQNHTSFGLLLVRTERAVYDVSFGNGHLMIVDSRIDPGFGIEFAVRCLDGDRITKVRHQIMDARGRTDENASTSGEHIRGFGIEQFGEIVNQISGQIVDVPLTYSTRRRRTAHVTGSDRSLKLQLGMSPESLLYDLEQIERVCARTSTVPGLDFIAQVRPLNTKDPRVAMLDERLDALLGKPDGCLALAVPTECADRYEATESFTVKVNGRKTQHSELDIDELRGLVAERPAGERLRALRGGTITLFADTMEEQRNSRDVPADRWISAEITKDAVTYFRLEDRWYEVGAEYLAVVEKRVAELLAEPLSVTLPSWPAEIDEGGFNERLAEQDGYVLLDKRTIHTDRFRGGGLEIADALGPEGQLVCVKKAGKTEPLNHLFAQARVAVETIRNDAEARAKLVEKLPDDHPADRSFRTPTVILGILLKNGRPVTSSTLFAFAKVSLLHAATGLQSMGARLEIASICR